MLKNLDKVLTGDLLKILCDMGHGDELVFADANFPAETCAKRLVRMPGISGERALQAILSVLPLDTYSTPAAVMDLTDSDKEKGMPEPDMWKVYQTSIDAAEGRRLKMDKVERFEFYERSKRAYAVIQTGEERQYGNLILIKGVVPPDEKPPKKNGSHGITRGAEYYRKQ